MGQISQKNTGENFMILMKNMHLGRSLQVSASFLDLLSNILSSGTNNSMNNLSFVRILNYTIISRTITLILAIKNSHCIIDCGETDR